MGVRCAPPQVHPGDTVDLDALIYVPAEAPGSLDQLWLACLPGPSEGSQACLTAVSSDVFGAVAGCAAQCASDPYPELCEQGCLAEVFSGLQCNAEQAQKGCLVGVGPTVSYTVPPDTVVADDEVRPIYVFMLATVLAGGLGDCFEIWADQAADGGSISPTIDCTLTLKQITVISDDEPIEDNPAFTAVTLDDDPLAAAPAVNEVALPGPEVDSTVVTLEAEFPLPEEGEYYLSWFSDCGKLEFERSFQQNPINRLRPAETGMCELHVVIRDGQGGVGWSTFFLDLQL